MNTERQMGYLINYNHGIQWMQRTAPLMPNVICEVKMSDDEKKYKDYYTEDLSLEYHLPCNDCVYRNEKIEDTPCLKCVHYVR